MFILLLLLFDGCMQSTGLKTYLSRIRHFSIIFGVEPSKVRWPHGGFQRIIFCYYARFCFFSPAGKAELSISLSKGEEDRDEKQASISLVFPERMAWGIYRILCLWKAP
jgi:hypothetical protein